MSANHCMRRDSFSLMSSCCAWCLRRSSLFVCLLECVIVYVSTIILAQAQELVLSIRHCILCLIWRLVTSALCPRLAAMQMTAGSANNIYLFCACGRCAATEWMENSRRRASVCKHYSLLSLRVERRRFKIG
jgi:hypothetical protein